MKSATIIIMLAILTMAACSTNIESNTPNSNNLEDGVIKFSSNEELLKYLNDIGPTTVSDNFMRSDVMMESLAFDAAGVSPTSAKISGTDYSQTNVQVFGVDEADIVKNDGKYIYTLTQGKLTITDAFPAKNAEILYENDIVDSPIQMFLNDDELIIFARDYDETATFSKYSIMPYPRSTPITVAYIIDIKDKSNPKIIDEYSVEGDFLEARMVDNKIVFVARKSVYYNDDFVDIPRIMAAGNKMTVDVIAFPHPQRNYQFNTVAVLDLNSKNFEAESFLLGYSTNMYMTDENLYLTYEKEYDQKTQEKFDKECFNEAIKETLPLSLQNRINSLNDWDEINELLSNYYDNLDEDEKNDFWEMSSKALTKCQEKNANERQKTIIQKIGIKNGIEYLSSGEVSGTVLNQFSMDEKGDKFRIATTLSVWTGSSSIRNNNVYVLDEELNILGSLEGIAKDERIYSTRFIDDRLYMVTFRTIDPFFVIDLSTDKPEILGELKIPGFSNYLHPYDENHVIGIGRETEGTEWGGVANSGIKISLFDVTDVNNPIQLDKYELGDRFAMSPALDDHKAFLFDKDKNILVIPVTERKGNVKYYYDTNGQTWRGAYVFGITPADGIELKGTVTHKAYGNSYYYYNNVYDVQRSLYIDDVLYTISGNKIVMTDLDTFDKINSVNFDIEAVDYPIYYR